MRRKPTKVTSKFASAADTAKVLGMSLARLRKLLKLTGPK